MASEHRVLDLEQVEIQRQRKRTATHQAKQRITICILPMEVMHKKGLTASEGFHILQNMQKLAAIALLSMRRMAVSI